MSEDMLFGLIAGGAIGVAICFVINMIVEREEK